MTHKEDQNKTQFLFLKTQKIKINTLLPLVYIFLFPFKTTNKTISVCLQNQWSRIASEKPQEPFSETSVFRKAPFHQTLQNDAANHLPHAN